MAFTQYLYGAFNLNDGIHYIVTGKDSPNFPIVNQTYFKIGRLEGVKKTGETVDEKTITLSMLVLGVSRVDLENALDTLYLNLNNRDQNLSLHTNDGRQYTADCIGAAFPLGPGDVISVAGTVTFVVTMPYAVATVTQQYTTGTVTLQSVSGSVYSFGTINIVGQGTVFSRPALHIVNVNGGAWTQIQVQQTTDSQTLTMTAPLPVNAADYIDIYCDPTGPSGFSAIVNGQSQAVTNGIFPVIEPVNTNFIVTVTSPVVPQASLAFAWNARFL